MARGVFDTFCATEKTMLITVVWLKSTGIFGQKNIRNHRGRCFQHPNLSSPKVLWGFKLVEQDLSFRSLDDTGKLFQRMNFGEMAEKFKMSHTKMSYVCCHGLGKAVLEETVTDIAN